MSLFVHLYGSEFPLSNCQTLQIDVNPEPAHSLNPFHSNIYSCGNRQWWPLDQSVSDLRFDNCPSYSDLQPQRHQWHWTQSCPVALPRGSGVGKEVATISIRQPPATTNHTKSTHNLSKNSKLATGTRHLATWPKCSSPVPSGFSVLSSSDRNSRAPTPTFSLTYNHSSVTHPFIALSSFLSIPWLAAYHALSFLSWLPTWNLSPAILLPD